MKPTPSQITREIKALELCKTYIPHFTAFGDDNFALIDAQIGALAWNWTVDKAYEWCDEDEPTREQEAVVDAAKWLAGEAQESPSAEWDAFKPKKEKST